MIVNPTREGWEILYHRGHARLAVEFALRWKEAERPPHFGETLVAIAQHDDLEREWEGRERTPAGAPLDFTLDTELKLDRMERLVTGALYRGRRVALLTSMHMNFLHEPSRGTNQELDRFLDEQKRLQEGWRGELGMSKEEADRSYALFQWCDRLSLILCQRQIPERERRVEISKGPDGRSYSLIQNSEGLLGVDPWPFQPARFTVEVDASYLGELSYSTDEALTKALREAKVETLRWTFDESAGKAGSR